mgnify:CR=1 FL=1
MRQHTRNAVGFVVLAILMAALFYWNINTGSVHLSLERMLTLLRWGNDGTTEGNILWKIRLSRLLGAALLGGALSIAGFLLQTFFKNPIAGPFVLGISSGSRLFVGFFLLAATPIVTEGFSPYVIFLAAFAGALAAMALVLAVSSRVQNLAMLLVIGMMIGKSADELSQIGAKKAHRDVTEGEQPIVSVKQLGLKGTINPTDLDIYPGQVVGFAGLLASGRTELGRLLYGADNPDSG